MSVRVRVLGGVGRFGRNATLVTDTDAGVSILVDAGVRFGDDDTPGFDGIFDLTALDDTLAAVVLTHGHEDHLGGLPFVWRRHDVTTFGTRFTARLARRKLDRVGLREADVQALPMGSKKRVGPFTFHFLAVGHSIPDAAAVVLETAAGTIVFSGDFRADPDPLVAAGTDLKAFRAVGDAGVALLLSDSTGALSAQVPRERDVIAPLTDLVKAAPGRVIVATYGSHVGRVAALVEVAQATSRRVYLLGTSLIDNVSDARALSYFSPGDTIAAAADLGGQHDQSVLVVCTGTQAEPMSVLGRAARGAHDKLAIQPGDTVVVSARAIPGNERAVARMLDACAKLGAHVFDGSDRRHVSGHGGRKDLGALLDAIRPRAFVPIHGGHRQLNAAIYRTVIVRMRFHEPTIAYVARRTAEGKSKRDIIRCLKRYVIREVYHHVRANPRTGEIAS